MLLFLACHLLESPEIATCEAFGCADTSADDTDGTGPGTGGDDADEDGVPSGDDCDDDDPDVGEAETVWTDADGDGYGDPDTEVDTCDVASDQVFEAGDCDDTTDQAAPGLTEVCGDGLDNDCDGTSNGCVPTGELSSEDADHAWEAEKGSYDLAGQSVAVLGDVDGDGQGEIAIGVPGDATYGGAVAVCGLDDAEGIVSNCAAQLTSSTTSVGLGYAVRAAGDVDGDGFADALVGAIYADVDGVSNTGAAVLFYGPLTAAIDETSAGIYGTTEASAQLGQALGVGNLDDDAEVELVVGSRYVGSAGGVYVLDGPHPAAGEQASVDDYVGAITASDGSVFAMEIGDPGDVDGDGYDDVLVSDYSYNGGGEVYVFRGPVDGRYDRSDADITLTGSTSGGTDYLGYSGTTMVADEDGDGYDEILVGALLGEGDVSSAGRAYLVDGPTKTGAIADAAHATLLGEASGSYAGMATASGDFDGDSIPDVMIGAPSVDRSTSVTDIGKVYMSYGPHSGTSRLVVRSWTATGVGQSDWFGEALATGDVDDDGHDDLLVGSYRANDSDGGAYLFLGSSY